jgi:glucose/arabinose dehydrogenase
LLRAMTRRLKSILGIGMVLIATELVYFWHRRRSVNPAPSAGVAMAENVLADRVNLPHGFSINTFAGGLGTPRMLRFTATGDLLVSSPGTGKVFLLERDADGDGRADGQRVVLDKLTAPHGLAIQDGWLYVTEIDGVLRIGFDAAARAVSGEPQHVITGLPRGGHWTKTIGIGPDGWLYVAMGSSCNVCAETDRRRAAITRYHLDGTGEEIYATGLRNAVGFAWQPGTGALYATDNGRDWLGDDFPPCEVNRVVQGGFYGWPFANGERVPDPDYGKGHEEDIAKSIPPAHAFGAHVAPLGITFYTGSLFPERYRGAAFVAQHGSWNRSKRSGYKVVALLFAADGSMVEEDFATGFMIDEQVFARPVDVAVGPDGALYVSDDFTGSVYRITYHAD